MFQIILINGTFYDTIFFQCFYELIIQTRLATKLYQEFRTHISTENVVSSVSYDGIISRYIPSPICFHHFRFISHVQMKSIMNIKESPAIRNARQGRMHRATDAIHCQYSLLVHVKCQRKIPVSKGK